MVTFLEVRIPIVGRVGVTDQCSFPIVGRGERARVGCFPLPRVWGEPCRTGDGWPSPRGAKWPQTMAGRSGELVSQPAIFADGAPAPPMTSFTASRVFSRSINATKAYDMTLVGSASFNGGIFLAVATVDRALKGSMVGERMNKSFGREVRENEMSWGILKGENPSFFSEFYRSTIKTLISQ
jgi:hypothetical protein